MDESDRARLAARIDRARGSTGQLKVIFDGLVDRVGLERASHQWWAAFGAEDASQT